MNKREIEEQSIAAFTLAVSRGYITSKSSENEVRDNAYEILEFMPDYTINALSDEDLEYATNILVSQLV